MNAITPDHYKTKSGLQVWDVTRYMSGNMAQAFQYVYRAGHKGSEIEDLRKAVAFLEDWYLHKDCPAMANVYQDRSQHEKYLQALLWETEKWKTSVLQDIWAMDYFANHIDEVNARKHAYPQMMEKLKARITELEGGGNG